MHLPSVVQCSSRMGGVTSPDIEALMYRIVVAYRSIVFFNAAPEMRHISRQILHPAFLVFARLFEISVRSTIKRLESRTPKIYSSGIQNTMTVGG